MKFFKIKLLVMFLSLINLPLALYAQDEALNEYYPLGEGDSWVYQRMEDNVLSKETLKGGTKEYVNGIETIKMLYEDGSYDCVGRDSEGIKLYKTFDADTGNYEAYTPPIILWPFNKELAKEYKCSYLTYNTDGNLVPDLGGEMTIEIEFAGREDIAVPAGEFLDCIKVSLLAFKEKYNGDFANEKSIVWLAKGVGEVKTRLEEIGFDSEQGATYSNITERELQKAIVTGIEYGR